MQLSHEYSIMQTSRAEGRTEGWAEGRAEGRAEGEEERKKLQEALEINAKALAQKDSMIANAVKNLAGQGMDPQQIAQILQLDVEEVRKNI
jgi:predicted transposase YdaD